MGQPSIFTLLFCFCDAYLMVNARVSSVFCSTSWALALPVAGLALELLFTLSTGRSPTRRFRRGSMLSTDRSWALI